MKTTLNEIRKHHPCQDEWKKLLRHLNKTKPDDEPLDLLTILESNGAHETLWCISQVAGSEEQAFYVRRIYSDMRKPFDAKWLKRRNDAYYAYLEKYGDGADDAARLDKDGLYALSDLAFKEDSQELERKLYDFLKQFLKGTL